MPFVLALVLGLSAVSAPVAAPQRPRQADLVVRLLADLETALGTGRIEAFEALADTNLPATDRDPVRRAIAGGPVDTVAVREQGRRAMGEDGWNVLADVLLARNGQTGRVATWELVLEARAGDANDLVIAGLREVSALDGLVQLSLDANQQYSLDDFSFTAPDFTLSVASGVAFVARAPDGVTALVVRGRGQVRFTPPDPAEQGQLRLFAGEPVYESDINAAFIRLQPDEFETRVASDSMRSVGVNRSEFERAEALFEEFYPRTFAVDLQKLGQQGWSLQPPVGGVIVEFDSRRHGWLTYARSPGEAEDISLYNRRDRLYLSLYGSDAARAEYGRYYDEDARAAYDVDHYDLDLSFDPDRQTVSGRGTLALRIRRPAVTALLFRLSESLSISSAVVRGQGRGITLRTPGQSTVILALPRIFTAGESLVLDVLYGGTLAPQNLDREALMVRDQLFQGDLLDSRRFAPEPRFLYSSAVDWYPRAEHTDFATATMRLAVPSEFQIVASGVLAGTEVDDAEVIAGPAAASASPSWRRTEYRANHPLRYLSCLISRFAPVGHESAPVPRIAAAWESPTPPSPAPTVAIDVVAVPPETDRAEPLPAEVASIVSFYADLVGEAPYPDLTLAVVNGDVPGGHSPAYFAMLQEPLPLSGLSWALDPVAFDREYAPFYLAHEIAHQWWGQAVGWKNYREQWLSEGLAQYFALLYAGHDGGPALVDTLVVRMRGSVLGYAGNGPIALGYRLGHIRGEPRVFRAVVYNKSAVVLHMLRRLIGDEAFFAGIRTFYRTWRFRKAGTDDLRQAFEMHTDRLLGRFFEQWIRQDVVPQLRVSTRIQGSGADEEAVIRIEQQQPGEPMELPLRILVEYQDRQVDSFDVDIHEQVSEHRVPLRGPVRQIQAGDDLSLYTVGR